MKPLIGITPDTHAGRKLKTRTPKEKIIYLWDRYSQALLDCGAVAVVLPVTEDKAQIRAMADRLDGIALAGGNFDVPPELFGQTPRPWLGPLKPERSRFEIALLLEAARKDKPILGICGGMQAINVAFGGTLLQDIANERPDADDHQQKNPKDRTSHRITVTPGTALSRIMFGTKEKKPRQAAVNSTHHQAIDELGKGLRTNARSKDGIIEGIESRTHRFLLGVQWHPELLYDRNEKQANIIKAFVKAAMRSQ